MRDLLLVAVDFSEHSRHALIYAAELGQKLECELEVLHVVHDPGHAPGYYAQTMKKKTLARLEDAAVEMMGAFMDETVALRPDLATLGRAGRHLVVGVPVKRILEVEGKLNPRMLVVGSQGRTGLSRMLIGSKAEQIVRLCKRPVIVVKE